MDADALFSIGWRLLAVLVLVFLNGFFVAAEFALVKVRDTQLEALAVKGNRRAKVARRIIHNLDAALSSAQLGITLASLGLGWIGEPVFARLLEPVMHLLQIESERAQHSIAFAVGFSAITFLHIVAGEQAPKMLAIRKPLPVSLWVGIPLQVFYRVSYPAIWLLNQSANWLLRQVGIQPVTESDAAHSAEELRLMLAAAQRSEGARGLGHEIVLNALDLRRRRVREVMRPRQEMVVFDTESTISQCLSQAESTRYSRFPLCEGGDIDHALGVVHIKDLYAMRLKARTAADLLPTASKIVYIPETGRLEKLLQLLLERRLHLAIVVDEYGGTVGMVTLENILEELVGQIQDEFDQETPLVVRVDDSTWNLSGALPLHELAELVGEPLQEEGVATVSGLVTQRLGGFPKTGDSVNVGSYRLQVEEMDGLRIGRLRLSRKPSEPGLPHVGRGETGSMPQPDTTPDI